MRFVVRRSADDPAWVLACPQFSSQDEKQKKKNETPTKGEVSEWSKVHDWKSCVAKVTEGSNPSLSAPAFALELCPERRLSRQPRQDRKVATVTRGRVLGAPIFLRCDEVARRRDESQLSERTCAKGQGLTALSLFDVSADYLLPKKYCKPAPK